MSKTLMAPLAGFSVLSIILSCIIEWYHRYSIEVSVHSASDTPLEVETTYTRPIMLPFTVLNSRTGPTSLRRRVHNGFRLASASNTA